MRHLNVLIACEESQAECQAFRELGHKAYSCDIQSCRPNGHPEWHIKGDVTPYLQGRCQFYTQDGKHHHISRWHLIIAHPPCTYLCKVGAQHLYKDTDMVIWWRGEMLKVNRDRFEKMQAAKAFFDVCLKANADFVAVENPLPMALAQLPKPDAFVEPFWFGVKYSKKTLYWLKNLPPIMADASHPSPKCYVRSSRGKYRSRTFPEVARALAKQWGDFVSEKVGINR